MAWDQATRVEARDFCRWIQIADKPAGPDLGAGVGRVAVLPAGESGAGRANPVTGKTSPGRRYAPATRAHSESVLRGFYEFHREMGSGPMVNPFPLARRGRGTRARAHQNPMQPSHNERSGLFRPRLVTTTPHHIPEQKFNEVFAALGSHRDRALVAFWVSTGAPASELLGARCGDVDVGQQLITVIRKGTQSMQERNDLRDKPRSARNAEHGLTAWSIPMRCRPRSQGPARLRAQDSDDVDTWVSDPR